MQKSAGKRFYSSAGIQRCPWQSIFAATCFRPYLLTRMGEIDRQSKRAQCVLLRFSNGAIFTVSDLSFVGSIRCEASALTFDQESAKEH